MANRNPAYVYGQDSIFDVPEDSNANDGIDSMLSRDQRRSTNHYYGQPPRPRSKGAPGKYHDNNFYNPNKYPILEQSNFHNQQISEADYLDQMVHSVERRGRYPTQDYDEEKQHSQLNSSYDNDDDDDDDENDDEETEGDSEFYLATANATRMRAVDGQNKLANNNNGQNNVLAYILGGFGLCPPPDDQGMKADAQVSHFETNGGHVTEHSTNTNTNTNSSGGFNICAPDQKELTTDTQVQRFAATTEPEQPANVPGGVEVKRPLPTPQAKKTPLQQFRERKLKLRQKQPLHEEKKEADLQETAAFPFNTRQFSDTTNKQQHQQQSDMEQGDLDLEEQLQHQLQLQEEEEELLQQLEEEQRKEQLEKDKKMDAAVDSGMDLCAIPGCPTSSPKRPPGNLAVSPNAPDFPEDPFEERDQNLFDDGEEQSRLEQIRQKKRTIEHQLETDYMSQNRVQVDTKYATSSGALQTAPMSLRNKAIVSFLVFLFVAAAALVAVSFFWPDLMPKLGRGGT
mmetsp:Transcript_30105/g.72258  ORF Transcript_30105/g.72258 Transcript_30105/m.72258 type:complete len:512 (+) Transcript_30105:257-1792(+)|eukprot:CAMPEP_0113648068 /NCGR_PEP_ID=MMETSP0017_2-20120614/25478_1 /TAXON_ID=2856 /ORGANISM="Cylindrotheca closterium" /LENGTH=511 /DNA_ID=CAMNT_0000560229 /DNA_START=253 /DNA_END=1788 /DNA_ORIENTATION=- /assembly_acc=CAM_ASM_000147